jgi:hypothetical protein
MSAFCSKARRVPFNDRLLSGRKIPASSSKKPKGAENALPDLFTSGSSHEKLTLTLTNPAACAGSNCQELLQSYQSDCGEGGKDLSITRKSDSTDAPLLLSTAHLSGSYRKGESKASYTKTHRNNALYFTTQRSINLFLFSY